ncbi:MAG: hypothetical protein IT280_11995 [Ignavibacteria bacterium]|nr:hypothetical protein [Ignavibacteria bacterium]
MLNKERFSSKRGVALSFIMPKKIFLFSSILIAMALYLSGCVNFEQKTVLKQDGSGSMTVHYWTKMSNLKSSTELGGFSFDEAKAKSNYSSSNTDVKSVKLEDKLDDSTRHATVELTFKNINDINSAKGFEKIKASWKEGKDGMDFSYTVPKDTSNAKNMGSDDIVLNYEFDFPAEVLKTNGRKDGQKVVYEKKLSDLKNDLEMTATVKNEGKKCGLFGMEFPLLALAGMMMFSVRLRRKK